MLASKNGLILILNEISFVITGVISTIGYQWLYYAGAGGGGLAMTSVLPSYIGMLMSLVIPDYRRSFMASFKGQKISHGIIISASLADVLGSLCTAIGLYYTGSGIYQVLYSSVVVFTALLSRFILQKPLSVKQWIAIITVNIGLALSASSASSDNDPASIFIGAAFMIFGTILISSAYILDERVIEESNMKGQDLCLYTGIYSTIFTGIYMLFYTVPKWNELIAEEVAEQGGDWVIISIVFFGLCVCSMGHNVAYFAIIGEVGGVTTGILQALRAVLVFLVSSALYCEPHPEQCFTMGKAISSLIVIGGVFLFTVAPKIKPKSVAIDV